MITTSLDIVKSQAALKYRQLILFYTYILLFVSIVFCFRAVSSMAIATILFIGVTTSRRKMSFTGGKSGPTLFTLACTLLFLLQSLALLYTDNSSNGWKLIERSSGLFFIPVGLFLSSEFLTTALFRNLVGYFVLILSVGSFYCLIVAAIKYLSGAPVSVFFYHDLVEPSLHHAIQYSLLVFIALVWLFENPNRQIGLLPGSFSRYIIPFLSIFLLLLSSKLIIIAFVFFLLYFFFHQRVKRVRVFIVCLSITGATLLLVSTRNPVGDRFRSAVSGNLLLFEQPSFGPNVYFNGTQFRLLQWRFTSEILNEQHAWLSGLTPGDAQSFLDKKYMETKMYTGIPGTDKRGFLGYHTHNQFLQSLLENGIGGLVAFIAICCTMFFMVRQNKTNELKWIIGLLISYCFTDAPFQTQYGILIFTLFPCIMFLSTHKADREPSFSRKQHLTATDPYRQPN